MNFPVKEIAKELDQILQFWTQKTVDVRNGGFFGRIDGKGKVYPKANKGVILNTSLLWTFSAAAGTVSEEKYRSFAERAFHYLMDHFWDELQGGLYWSVDVEGIPVETKKQICAQAFGIYAFSEFYLLTGNEEALERAASLFHLIEKNSFDQVNGGYLEALDRNWHPLEDMRLSKKGNYVKKSTNTHLHILEAYTNLYRAWSDGRLRDQLEALIRLFLDRIIDANSGHLNLFFDKKWQGGPDPISFGHDIESSWLLQEAAGMLKKEKVTAAVLKIADKIAETALAEGMDTDGGLYRERSVSGHIDRAKIWWRQAEAMVGFLYAWKRTDKAHFLEAARKNWTFIRDHLIDSAHGEWFWGLDRHGKPDVKNDKAGPRKTPYHNTRACLEALKMFEVLPH